MRWRPGPSRLARGNDHRYRGEVPISFDITGFRRIPDPPFGLAAWTVRGTPDIVSLAYHDMVPDLPAALDGDTGDLLRALARERSTTGCLLEAGVARIDGQDCLTRLEKLPLPNRPRGQAFCASVTVPKAACSATLQILCPEDGVTGMREAVLAARIGFADFYRPHPFDPWLKNALPCHAADDRRYDDEFPDHPLTRARRWLDRTVRTARLTAEFAALRPFSGP